MSSDLGLLLIRIFLPECEHVPVNVNYHYKNANRNKTDYTITIHTFEYLEQRMLNLIIILQYV